MVVGRIEETSVLSFSVPRSVDMSNLNVTSLEILEAARGDDVWIALNLLPTTPQFEERYSRSDGQWSLADYFLAIEYGRLLLMTSPDTDLTVDISSEEGKFLLSCLYDKTKTVPQLIAADLLRNALVRLSVDLAQLRMTPEPDAIKIEG
jgi:hypothetical protein